MAPDGAGLDHVKRLNIGSYLKNDEETQNIVLFYSSVPGVEQGSSTVDNFHGLKPIHLPLMFQKNRGQSRY